jgi:hypothetical protein
MTPDSDWLLKVEYELKKDEDAKIILKKTNRLLKERVSDEKESSIKKLIDEKAEHG